MSESKKMLESSLRNTTTISTRRRRSSSGTIINASTSSVTSSSGGNYSAARKAVPARENPQKKEVDLTAGDILKVLPKINHGTNLTGLTLTELLENPKSCRNLLAQFDAVPPPIPQYSLSIGNHENTMERLFAPFEVDDVPETTNANATLSQSDYNKDILNKLESSAKDWSKKYGEALRADLDAERSKILKPELVQSVAQKLTDLNQAVRLISFCPVGREIKTLLREQKSTVGLPCSFDKHEEIVKSIEQMDAVLFGQTSIPLTDELLQDQLEAGSQELEKQMDLLDAAYDQCFRLDSANEKLFGFMKRSK